MSSHHIVREKQEPALLIISFDNFLPEHLGQLLEWSPTVIVTEKVFKQAEGLGIKIDGVVGIDQSHKSLHHTRHIETEDSHLQDALKYLVGEQYPAVNIVADEFVLKDFLLFAEHINLAVFTKNKKIFTVRSGFSKWQTKGQHIELMHELKNLQTAGLEYVTPTILETKKDGFYSLSFEQPFAFIAEDY